jgi:ABC-type lipoprotein export system ATPase subunit
MFGSQPHKNGSNNGNGNGNGNGKSNGHYHNGNDHLIELHGLVKTYRSAAGDFTALKEIDLEVDCGEFVAVIGKSGSGKSTLVNMITGIDRPTAGEILVGDTAIQTLKEGKLAEWRGRNVGVIFQFFQLLPTLTAAENIMLPMDFCHMYTRRERRDRALHLLELVGVADQADKLPSTLSGGQQQRVAIARALANDPPILAADEPTGNLDSKTAEAVFGLFETLVAQGKTILMVTHDRDLARRATRTVILSDGEVIEEYLAKTFPTLNEAQLIEATRSLEPQKHAPGALILQQGATPEKFFLITRGGVEVVLPGAGGQEIVAATMVQGQYFGEVELRRGGGNIAAIRADRVMGVEVAALKRAAFERLVAGSAPIREAIDRTVEMRVAENEAARGQRGNGHV